MTPRRRSPPGAMSGHARPEKAGSPARGGCRSPLTIFVRTLARSIAIFLGAGWIFLNPSLDWSTQRGVTAQKGPAEAAVDALLIALLDQDPGVRGQAVRSLGDMGNPRAVPALIERLGDHERDVRLLAIAALASIGDGRALLPLARAADGRDVEARDQALSAIRDIASRLAAR